jgi:hypothetical protein
MPILSAFFISNGMAIMLITLAMMPRPYRLVLSGGSLRASALEVVLAICFFSNLALTLQLEYEAFYSIFLSYLR